ncbi:hypothetical protein [Mesorhizobium sp. NPDC059025]|uniref:hypothetical protein n=1 Tax=unclassified Mesorhizobium TaxID=325217 RepID=UPI0036B2DE7A
MKLPEIPEFGDGYLTGIELGEKTAVLSIQSYDGAKYQLRLSDLEAFLANEFRQGNIISSLEFTSGSSFDIAKFTSLWPESHPEVAAEYHQKHKAFIERQWNKVACGDAVLVNLTASYGCELVAVCGTVDLVALNISETTEQVSILE